MVNFTDNADNSVTLGDKVEVIDQRVSVCRDHANGICQRQQCKYYHIPVAIPPANVMAVAAVPYSTTTTTITSTGPTNSSSVESTGTSEIAVKLLQQPAVGKQTTSTNHNNNTNNNYNNHSNVITTGCLTSTTTPTTTTTTTSTTTNTTHNHMMVSTLPTFSMAYQEMSASAITDTITGIDGTSHHTSNTNQLHSSNTINPSPSNHQSTPVAFPSSSVSDAAQLHMWHVLSHNL